MPELTNPSSGKTATFTEDQARWYRNRGWVDVDKPAAVKSETVAEVRDRVGDDPELARQALAAEQARDNPRSTLVEHLQSVVEPTDA